MKKGSGFKRELTPMARKEDAKRNWLIFNAEGKTLGRLAAEITKVLRGKHRPDFTPHVDSGDGVIVINAEKVYVTGHKEAQMTYCHYTGFMGGLRTIPYKVMQATKPEEIISITVRGMMPKTKLAKAQLRRLRVFAGTEHCHEAQQPVNLNI